MTPLPLSERLERLTMRQRYLLDRCREAQLAKDRATEEWRSLLTLLVEEGFTYGMLSAELGMTREAIFRLVDRHRTRLGVKKEQDQETGQEQEQEVDQEVVDSGIVDEDAG